jgi:MFS family permease
MPTIFGQMGYTQVAPALSAVLDFVRLLTFILLIYWPGWHGRASVLVISVVAMPTGFFMVLFAGNLAAALAGQFLFGLSCGLVYYAGLYYAMVVANASVGAGGKHESLIGLGFVIGPSAGLVGLGLADVFGNRTGGMLLGIGPLFAIAVVAAIWALRPLISGRLEAKA